ncbi:MAG: DUF3341 domain-containing protein [Sandaracinaceae bacterium]
MKRGMLAEFDRVEALRDAIRALRDEGYERMDAATPFPCRDIEDALRLPPSRLPFVTGGGALLGGLLGYLILYWTQVVDYPLNVGGRPAHPWPAFIPLTFESAVLVGGVATFVAFFIVTGLPQLWHPTFEVEGIERASADRFVLLVDADDPRFDHDATRDALERTGALRVTGFDAGSGS